LIAIGLLYVGIENPIVEENVEVRKLELQELVQMLQHEAESHARLRKNVPIKNVPPTAADLPPNGADYTLLSRKHNIKVCPMCG